MASSLPETLVLFDIDGTLLDTQDAGVEAYVRAGRGIFGIDFQFEGVPLHGRLDHENYADAVARHRPELEHLEHQAAFRRAYAEALATIADERDGFDSCPGVAEFVARLDADESFEVGLLTGNWEETGRFKIRRSGLDDRVYRCNAFADDGLHRDELVPVAHARFTARHGQPPRRVVVVGDTPRDVACALAGDAIPLAVATGIFSPAELEASGAQLTVESLEDHDQLMAFLRLTQS